MKLGKGPTSVLDRHFGTDVLPLPFQISLSRFFSDVSSHIREFSSRFMKLLDNSSLSSLARSCDRSCALNVTQSRCKSHRENFFNGVRFRRADGAFVGAVRLEASLWIERFRHHRDATSRFSSFKSIDWKNIGFWCRSVRSSICSV